MLFIYILVASPQFLSIFSWLLRLVSTTYYKNVPQPTYRVHASLQFRIFLSKRRLILTQEGKEYLYSDAVVRIHES